MSMLSITGAARLNSAQEAHRHYEAVRARLLRPANAVKDTAPPPVPRDVRVVQHADEPLPPTPKETYTARRSKAVEERIAAIHAIWRPGISASEIAGLIGTTKGAVMGLYARNPDELQSCPLRAKGGHHTVWEARRAKARAE